MSLLTETLPERSSEYIRTLDGWRAVAILAVLISHANPAGGAGGSGSAIFGLVDRLGSAGVMVFFAISGYLICTRLLIDQTRRGTIGLRTFYVRRAFRILPPALCYLAAILALHLAGLLEPVTQETFHWGSWFAGLFFTINYLPVRTLSLNHLWSLSVEEQFYLVWPGILAAAGRRVAAVVAALIVIGVPVVRVLVLNAASLSEYSRILERTEMRIDSFIGPCLIALALTRPEWRARITRVATPAFQFLWLTGVALCSAIPLLIRSTNALQRGFMPALITMLVVSTTLNSTGPMGRLLETLPLRAIGRLSYSIYLWQQLALYCRAAASIRSGTFVGSHRVYVIASGLLITALLAWLSYRFVEAPLVTLGRRIATGTPRRSERAA